MVRGREEGGGREGCQGCKGGKDQLLLPYFGGLVATRKLCKNKSSHKNL